MSKYIPNVATFEPFTVAPSDQQGKVAMYRNKTFRVCALVVIGVAASDGAAQAACGTASWYHEGAKTANGERYRPDGITAAHKTLPFGTRVLVRNQRTGRTVTVRINDRGPFIGGRIIDLSRGAKRVIGMDGLAPVCLTVLGRGERYADAGDTGARRVSRRSRGTVVGRGERYADAGDTGVRRVSRRSRNEVRTVYRTTQTNASYDYDDDDDAAEERTVRKHRSHQVRRSESHRAAHYRKMRELRAERAALAEEADDE
jgi:rare lipoprotein A